MVDAFGGPRLRGGEGKGRMDWTDEAITLSWRPHGESGAVASVLTRDHGRHAGLVRGGRSSRMRATLEPGTQVTCHWRGRLAEHLGAFDLEPIRAFAPGLLDRSGPLAALASACALADACLAEREPHPAVFRGMAALLPALEGEHWGEVTVRWELGLLAEVGFALELDVCAVTGVNDLLTHVSPRTGRAVSASAAEPFLERLLPLPGFLSGRGGGGPAEVAAGLHLTGHFLERHVLRGPLPDARARLAEWADRRAGVERRAAGEITSTKA